MQNMMVILQKQIRIIKAKKQRVFLIQTQKRSMQQATAAGKTAVTSVKSMGWFSRVSDYMFHGPRKYSRGFATWNNFIRKEDPVEGKAPPMEIDLDTGLEIMNVVDYSGKNHILLNQSDWLSEKYYMIRGSFTTSPSPFKGKHPIFFAPKTFDGQTTYQYLHVYDWPRLLPKSAVGDIDVSTFFLPHHAEIDALIQKHSIPGLDVTRWT